MKLPTPKMVSDAATAGSKYTQQELEEFAREWRETTEGKSWLAKLEKAKPFILTRQKP